jgi:DNA-binding IclR family transcriptional regulator
MRPAQQPADQMSYAGRLIAVLNAFAEGPDVLSVKELSEQLSLPASSTHRVLEALVEAGFLERARQRRYRIGTEFFRIAARVEHRFELVAAAKPLMARAVEQCGETCLLGLLTASRNKIVLAHKVDTQLQLRFKFDLLQNITPAWGSLGRSIMAWLSDADLRRVISEAEPSPVTGKPLPDLETLQRELRRTRTRGVAVTRGQRAAPDAVGISAPFFDATGQVRGAIGVVAPEFRLTPEKTSAISDLVKTQAGKLSRVLGHRTVQSRAG